MALGNPVHQVLSPQNSIILFSHKLLADVITFAYVACHLMRMKLI